MGQVGNFGETGPDRKKISSPIPSLTPTHEKKTPPGLENPQNLRNIPKLSMNFEETGPDRKKISSPIPSLTHTHEKNTPPGLENPQNLRDIPKHSMNFDETGPDGKRISSSIPSLTEKKTPPGLEVPQNLRNIPKLSPDDGATCSSNRFQGFPHSDETRNHKKDIVNLPPLTESEEDPQLYEDDYMNLLVPHDEPLSNEQVTEQDNKKTFSNSNTNTNYDVKEKRRLKIHKLHAALKHIYDAIDIIKKNDPNSARSEEVSGNLLRSIAVYQHMYDEEQMRGNQ